MSEEVMYRFEVTGTAEVTRDHRPDCDVELRPERAGEPDWCTKDCLAKESD